MNRLREGGKKAIPDPAAASTEEQREVKGAIGGLLI